MNRFRSVALGAAIVGVDVPANGRLRDVNDKAGQAETPVRVQEGEGYLVRVTQQTTSVPARHRAAARGGVLDEQPPFNGRHRSTVQPGRAVPVTIVVYRLDPIEGWRYTQRFRRNSRGGSVSAPLRLSQPERWRARAVFHGTRTASESRTRYAFVTAEAPLQERR